MGVIPRAQAAEGQLKRNVVGNLSGGMWCVAEGLERRPRVDKTRYVFGNQLWMREEGMRGEMELNPPGSPENDPNEEEGG
jgi:hypothetical protein